MKKIILLNLCFTLFIASLFAQDEASEVSGSKIEIWNVDGKKTVRLIGNVGNSPSQFGMLDLKRQDDATGSTTTVRLSADQFDGGYFLLTDANGETRVRLYGDRSSDPDDNFGQLSLSCDSEAFGEVFPPTSIIDTNPAGLRHAGPRKRLINMVNSAPGQNHDWYIGLYESTRPVAIANSRYSYVDDETHIFFEYEDGLKATIDEDGSYYQVSDRRNKQKIKSLEDVTSTLMKLEPSSYEMKTTPGKKSIGFIAQNIKDNFPELVEHYKNKEEDKYLVNYSGLIPVLTKALQEQQNTINKLEDRLSRLESNK